VFVSRGLLERPDEPIAGQNEPIDIARFISCCEPVRFPDCEIYDFLNHRDTRFPITAAENKLKCEA